MALTGLAQVLITVDDLDGAIQFYGDRLGLPLAMSFPEQSMAFFTAGPVRLYVARPESPEFTSHPILYFATDDIDREYQRLFDAGLDPRQQPQRIYAQGDTETWLAFFTGYEGHPVALMETRTVEAD
jgi:catechol 2,3-dioxygenase-like lactoylglutathione lyase family enzyme